MPGASVTEFEEARLRLAAIVLLGVRTGGIASPPNDLSRFFDSLSLSREQVERFLQMNETSLTRFVGELRGPIVLGVAEGDVQEFVYSDLHLLRGAIGSYLALGRRDLIFRDLLYWRQRTRDSALIAVIDELAARQVL